MPANPAPSTGLPGVAVLLMWPPGRTRQINFFRLDDNGYLADLPGYGYAKVPEATSRRWGLLLSKYLQTRISLIGLVLTLDARHPITPLDDAGLVCPHRQASAYPFEQDRQTD